MQYQISVISAFSLLNNVSTEKQFISAKWTVVSTNQCMFQLSPPPHTKLCRYCATLINARQKFLNIITCQKTVMLYFPCTLNPYWCMNCLVGWAWGWGRDLLSEDRQGGFETSTFSVKSFQNTSVVLRWDLTELCQGAWQNYYISGQANDEIATSGHIK